MHSSKVFIHVLVVVALLGAAGRATGQEAQLSAISTDAEREDQARARALYSRAQVDPELGILLRPLDRKAMDRVFKAAETGGPITKRTALGLMRHAVAENAFQEPEDRNILAETVERLVSDSSLDITSREVAEQIRWHLRVQDMRDPQRRAAMLGSYLGDPWHDVTDYESAAIEYLVDLGPDGAPVLDQAVKDRKCDLRDECLLALQRIEVRQRVAAMGASSMSVDMLLTTLSKPDNSRRLSRWYIGQLASLRPVSDFALTQLAEDSAMSDFVRHAAKVALAPGAASLAW